MGTVPSSYAVHSRAGFPSTGSTPRQELYDLQICPHNVTPPHILPTPTNTHTFTQTSLLLFLLHPHTHTHTHTHTHIHTHTHTHRHTHTHTHTHTHSLAHKIGRA